MDIKKIVLAYSGGLDTSVLLSWIKETYDAEIIAFCANIGQEEELQGPRKAKAKQTGASKIYIDDLQEEFARDFIFPMIQAGAIYEGQYFLGTSIARPLIAKRMVEIAREGKAPTPSPTAPPARATTRCASSSPPPRSRRSWQVIAPWRDDRFRDEFPGRAEMIAYCAQQEDPRAGQREEAVLDGPQPPAHLLRGRHPRRPVVRRLRDQKNKACSRALRVARGRAGQARSTSRSISRRATASR